MCKKQTSVSHSSTESETISLDAGLRMDGLLALNLWDVVIEVLRSTNITKKSIALASGDWQLTETHSNKNRIGHPTPLVSGNRNEQCTRKIDQVSNMDQMPSNTHSSQGESQLYTFEDNEAV